MILTKRVKQQLDTAAEMAAYGLNWFERNESNAHYLVGGIEAVGHMLACCITQWFTHDSTETSEVISSLKLDELPDCPTLRQRLEDLVQSLVPDAKPEGTDPYGHLEFAVGSGDDFHCFDYCVHDDGTMTLHSVLNSETGRFIQDAADPVRVPVEEAAAVARSLVDDAINWICDNTVEHDAKGWNQSPGYFVRAVERAVERSILGTGLTSNPAERHVKGD